MSLIFEFPASSDEIARLHTLSRQFTYRGLYGDYHLDYELLDKATGIWRERFEAYDPKQDFLIAAMNAGNYVGFAYASERAEEAEGVLLDNMHVHPDYKGQGIGATLLGLVAQWTIAKDKNLPLYLEAYDYNQNAIDFYTHKGGVQVSFYEEIAPGGKQVGVRRFAYKDPSILI